MKKQEENHKYEHYNNLHFNVDYCIKIANYPRRNNWNDDKILACIYKA